MTEQAKEKKTRKSSPRPGSGRRGSDGAIGLKLTSMRLYPSQIEKLKSIGGSAAIRAYINHASDNPLYIVELANGNWHTLTMSEEEANSQARGWNAKFPGDATVRKAQIIFQD